MSPNEALAMIDHVCSQVQLNRQGHAQLTAAINVLHQLVLTVTPPNQVAKEPQGVPFPPVKWYEKQGENIVARD